MVFDQRTCLFPFLPSATSTNRHDSIRSASLLTPAACFNLMLGLIRNQKICPRPGRQSRAAPKCGRKGKALTPACMGRRAPARDGGSHGGSRRVVQDAIALPGFMGSATRRVDSLKLIEASRGSLASVSRRMHSARLHVLLGHRPLRHCRRRGLPRWPHRSQLRTASLR